MTHFHAVMLDETGCEFGVGVEAASRSAAYEKLREDYPESRCVQLESPEDADRRNQEMYDHVSRGGDWDDEGRPIYHYDDWDDEEEEEDDDWDDYTDEERAERHERMAELGEDD